MSKEAIPFVAEDISAFSKALGKQLRAAETPPGHLALMNMVARAGGYRNFQHLRASEAAKRRLDDPPVVEAVDHKRIELILASPAEPTSTIGCCFNTMPRFGQHFLDELCVLAVVFDYQDVHMPPPLPYSSSLRSTVTKRVPTSV